MTKYVKSFSKGQITIPKEVRESLALGDDFWLKLSIEGNKMVFERAEQEKNDQHYAERLKKIKGGWLTKDEYRKNRAQTKRKFKDLHW